MLSRMDKISFSGMAPSSSHRGAPKLEPAQQLENSRPLDSVELLNGAKGIQPLESVQPANASQQRALFLAGEIEQPEFRYHEPAREAHAQIEESLHGIVFSDDTIGRLQSKKRAELIELSRVATHPGNAAVVKAATLAVYGRPSRKLVAQAKRLLELLPATPAQKTAKVTLGPRMSKELLKYGLEDWQLTESTGGSTHVDPANKEVVVPQGRKVGQHIAERLAVHEVGVHVLRAANGYEQPDPLFAVGTAGYEATEEGLAAYGEVLSGTSEPNVLRKYAARVLAVDSVAEGSDFRSTFEMLKEQGLSLNQSWDVALRVHRGGGYLKDHIYLEGLMDVRDYAKRGGDLRKLFVGKVSLEDLPLVDRMLAAGELKFPRRLPDFVRSVPPDNPLLQVLDEASSAPSNRADRGSVSL
jgi:uncharacterized protein (TIGR02421 family)